MKLAITLSVIALSLFVGFADAEGRELVVKPRYEATLDIEPEPKVGQVCQLRLKLRSLVDSPETGVYFHVPEGIELVSGSQTWKGDLGPGGSLSLALSIRVSEPGSYYVYAGIGTRHNDSRHRSGRIVKLYMKSDETGAVLGSAPPAVYYTPLPVKRQPFDTTGTPVILGNLTISGTIDYLAEDFPPDPPQEDVLTGIRVEIWGILGGIQALLSVVTTNEYGRYSYQYFPSGYDALVVVQTTNAAAWLSNTSAFSQTWSQQNVTQNVYDADISVSPPEWARVLENMFRARQWSVSRLNWSRSAVQVHYHDEQGGAYFSPPDDIHIYSDDVWEVSGWDDGSFVCCHEYGHAVLYERYGWWDWWWAIGRHEYPPFHWFNTVMHPNRAFDEGWANFVGHAVFASRIGIENVGLEDEGVEDYYTGSHNNGHPWWQGGSPYENTDGSKVEGAVMSYLWDLYDSKWAHDATPMLDDESSTAGSTRSGTSSANSIQETSWNSGRDGTTSARAIWKRPTIRTFT